MANIIDLLGPLLTIASSLPSQTETKEPTHNHPPNQIKEQLTNPPKLPTAQPPTKPLPKIQQQERNKHKQKQLNKTKKKLKSKNIVKKKKITKKNFL